MTIRNIKFLGNSVGKLFTSPVDSQNGIILQEEIHSLVGNTVGIAQMVGGTLIFDQANMTYSREVDNQVLVQIENLIVTNQSKVESNSNKVYLNNHSNGQNGSVRIE